MMVQNQLPHVDKHVIGSYDQAPPKHLNSQAHREPDYFRSAPAGVSSALRVTSGLGRACQNVCCVSTVSAMNIMVAVAHGRHAFLL